MIENRRTYRLPFRRKFIFTSAEAVHTGNAVNISAGGVFLSTLDSELLKRGQYSRCVFQLELEEPPLCLDAEVVRVVAQSPNPEELPGIGLVFKNAAGSEEERLVEFMERNRKNYEVASAILMGGEPDLLSLQPLLDQMHLPPLADMGDLRFFIERILKSIELVEKNLNRDGRV